MAPAHFSILLAPRRAWRRIGGDDLGLVVPKEREPKPADMAYLRAVTDTRTDCQRYGTDPIAAPERNAKDAGVEGASRQRRSGLGVAMACLRFRRGGLCDVARGGPDGVEESLTPRRKGATSSGFLPSVVARGCPSWFHATQLCNPFGVGGPGSLSSFSTSFASFGRIAFPVP